MNNQVLSDDIKLFALNFKLLEQLKDKTFLITGATGLIGSVMVKCLLELNRQMRLGIKVIAVVRNLDKAMMVYADEYSQIDFLQLELSEITQERIGRIVNYIVHLASPTASKYFVEHPVETLRTSIDGTTAILEYAKAAQVDSVVFASSLEVYGTNEDGRLIDESFQGYVNPLDVRSSYNMGKRAAECLCHSYANEYQLPVKIARLTQTTGAGIAKDDNRIIAQFARLTAEGKDIILHTTGEAARPYCYTTDAVSALLYILLKGKNGEAYNVANEDTYISARDMAEYLKKNFNPNIDIRVELNDNMGYAPATKLQLSSNKLKELGWKPRYQLYDIFDNLIKSMAVI
jgi:nucleoside-diphosphate-sugar epimerase